MNLTILILLMLKISIVLNVVALGLKATPAAAICLFRRPRELGRAFLSMNMVMPLLALGLGMAFDLNPAVKIALVALSVSPIPPLLPNKVLKAGARQDYTVGLLTAAAVLAIVVIPATMEIFDKLVGVPLHMAARPVAKLVLTTTLAPLFAGIGIRMLAPAFAERAAKPVGIFASVLLAASLLPVLLGTTRTMLSLIGNGTLLVMSVFALVGLIAGHLLGGPDHENSRVLGIATASRHPGMAAAIAHANFPEQKLVLPAVALYLIVSAIVSALLPAAIRMATSSERRSTLGGTHFPR
jgi:BASS family bile acid:Na+ symporter